MKARDLMTPDPRAVTPGDPVSRAAVIMRDLDVGLVPVVDDLATLRVRGVITDRDIAARCVALSHSPDCVVCNHMSPDPWRSVAPDADVEEVRRQMKEQQLRRLLVTDGDRLLGIIAETDLERVGGPADAAPHASALHLEAAALRV